MFMISVQIFNLARPFWEDKRTRKSAWILGGVLVLSVFLLTAVSMELAETQKLFYDALQNRNAKEFGKAIGVFFTMIALLVAVLVSRSWLEMALKIRWREFLTQTMLSRWLQGSTFYRIERDSLCDNPDQRLTDDLTGYVQLMISLTLGFIGNLGTLGTMGWLLWKSAGAVSFHFSSGVLTIPGYLFWVAVIWGLLQTLVTHLAGRKLAGATVEQQLTEADFRFALAKVRDSAEQVALYRGNEVEQQRLMRLFEAIRMNWAVLMKYNIFLSMASGSFSAAAIVVPILAMAPKVLSGDLSIGTLMQDIAAFAATSQAIAWFALSYRDLFQLSARVQRISGMIAAMESAAPQGIEIVFDGEAGVVRGENIELGLPDGKVLSRVDAIDFKQGERWLVRGPSGCGKSTLLRSIAGLWPFKNGRIVIPKGARVMFIPQKSYLPDGPLSEALSYPRRQYEPAVLEKALIDCRLGYLVTRLAESDRWSHRLSPGEQQRLAFAQALLNRPEVLFMDEATSALDNETEAYLIQLLIDRLPRCTLISVAHRTSLDIFHTHTLLLPAPQR